MIEYVVDHVD